MAKTDEIVLLGGADRTTTEVNKLLGQLPPAVQALTGVDLSGVSNLHDNFWFVENAWGLRSSEQISSWRQLVIFPRVSDNFEIDGFFQALSKIPGAQVTKA